MQLDFLRSIVRTLDDAGIPHMLAGSMASSFHGEPRMTHGIDMVIDPTEASIQRFTDALDRPRYYAADLNEAVRQRGMANVIDTETGWKVDLIVRRDRPFSREEFDRRQAAVIDDIDLDVATAEDTVLAKLEWRAQSGSDQQFRDVVAILSAQELDLEYLRRWAPALGISDALEEALVAAAP